MGPPDRGWRWWVLSVPTIFTLVLAKEVGFLALAVGVPLAVVTVLGVRAYDRKLSE